MDAGRPCSTVRQAFRRKARLVRVSQAFKNVHPPVEMYVM